MDNTLLIVENIAKAAAFLLMAFIFVRSIRSELE